MASNTSSTPAAPAPTAPTAACRSTSTTRWTTRSACTPPPSAATSCWRTATAICTACRPPGCASLPCTARGDGPTWRRCCSRTPSSPAGPIEVYNGGHMLRDFTYIDDVVEAVLRLSRAAGGAGPDFDPLHPDPATSHAPFRIYNVGNQQPVALSDFIDALEEALGRSAERLRGRCRAPTWRPPAPTPTTCARRSAGPRPRRCAPASSASSNGFSSRGLPCVARGGGHAAALPVAGRADARRGRQCAAADDPGAGGDGGLALAVAADPGRRRQPRPHRRAHPRSRGRPVPGMWRR
jgi:hypothetical protein